LRFVALALSCAALLVVMVAVSPARAFAACVARAAASPGPSSSPSPSSSSSPSPAPSAEPRLYAMGDEIFALDRDATFYYNFQGNDDGSAKSKRELRYDRNLWDTCAQLQIRLPVITRYPTAPSSFSPHANPFSGFGNAELGYSYNVAQDTFNHSLEVRAAFPTASNGVESLDTQLKLFYTTKWKWKGGSLTYGNEYDQTVIRPPGAGYTSYYEGKLTLPEYAFVDSPGARGLKISAIYNYRVLFNDGSIIQSAVGGTLFGNIGDVALNAIDSWGLGGHGLWKYKVEASAVVGLP
jgi:hypothetical protein